MTLTGAGHETRAPGIAAAKRVPHDGGIEWSNSPCRTVVGAAIS